MKQILKVHFQRILSLFVLCVLCVAMVLGGHSTAPVAYADTVIGDVQMDSSNVMDDLQNSTIDGVKFDISNYAFNEDYETQVFMLGEYCYSFYSNLRDNYGLYVYVWNPQALKFKTNSTLNAISLRAGADNGAGHTKYMLLYLNQCEIPNYEGLFLKFKVMLSGEQKEQIFDRLASDKRVYDVSEIELVLDGNSSADSYFVDTTYTYEGYAKGYGMDVNAESTLVYQDEQSETLSLDVHSTYFYPDGTHSDGITRDVLQSVYFSVPNKYITAYGEMSAVHATWLDARTAPMLVTGNRDIYDTIYPFLGEYVDGGTREDFEQRAFQYSIVATKAVDEAMKDEDMAPYGGYFAYNPYFGMRSGSTNYVNSYDTLVEMLSILFYADGGNAGDYVITAESLLGDGATAGWFETYTETHGGELVNGRFSKDLFSDVASDFEDITIKAGDTYKLTDNIVSNSAWDALFGNKVQSESFIPVSAIQAVTSADVEKYEKSEFCDEFFVDESDYDDLCAYIETAESKEEPETVYLFRYKQSEYVSAQATEYERTTQWFVGSGDLGVYSYIDLNAYFAQMWVQLGFDILDVTFSNGVTSKTLGVAMSPIDVAFDGKPPAHWVDDSSNEWWKLVLMVLALIILLVILMPILPYIAKVVVWIIMLPFKAIAAIVKGIQKAARKKPKTAASSPTKAVKAPQPKTVYVKSDKPKQGKEKQNK